MAPISRGPAVTRRDHCDDPGHPEQRLQKHRAAGIQILNIITIMLFIQKYGSSIENQNLLVRTRSQERIFEI